eukprot:GFYU01006160.1.p1 GENE.GFYU01006160.1~~GFYU01006160.1.p1  ORF type:complete len:474 (-),score=110.91 GFYU01006160.1:77-1498(-)
MSPNKMEDGTVSTSLDQQNQTKSDGSSKKDRVLIGLNSFTILVTLVYFVQGAARISRLAWTFFLKHDLKSSPADIQNVQGSQTVPWTIKPIYGILSDFVPIAGYRRKPYLMFSGLIGVVAWLLMGTVIVDYGGVLGGVMLASFSLAIGDVIADSLVVERTIDTPQEEVAKFQSMCWGSHAFGSVVAVLISGYLLDSESSRTVFLITMVFPLVVFVVALLLSEKKVDESHKAVSSWPQLKEILKFAWRHFKSNTLWKPVLFILLSQMVPSAGQGLFFFYTKELGYEGSDKHKLGNLMTVEQIARLLAVGTFQKFFTSVDLRKYFMAATTIRALVGFLTLMLVTGANESIGISNDVFVYLAAFPATFTGTMTWMPIVVLAAGMCPTSIEGTFFAIVMSVSNVGEMFGELTGASMMEGFGITEDSVDNLWKMVLIINFLLLTPLIYTYHLLVPTAKPEDHTAEAMEARDPIDAHTL